MLLSETRLTSGAYIQFRYYTLIAACHPSQRAQRDSAVILIRNKLKYYRISPVITANAQLTLINRGCELINSVSSLVFTK